MRAKIHAQPVTLHLFYVSKMFETVEDSDQGIMYWFEEMPVLSYDPQKAHLLPHGYVPLFKRTQHGLEDFWPGRIY